MERLTYPCDTDTPLPDSELMFPSPEPDNGPKMLGLVFVLLPIGAAMWGILYCLFRYFHG